MTNANYTHKVYFKKPTHDPVLLTQWQADMLIEARGQDDYDPKNITTVGSVQCEMGELGLIEKLSVQKKVPGSHYCQNERCSNESRMHQNGQPCDYDITGKCSNCQADLIERCRDFSMLKWHRPLCENCSSFGKAKLMFPGKPTTELCRMRGLAAYYIDKNMTDDEVVETVNSKLTKSNIGKIS